MSFSLRSVAAGLVLVTASLLSGCGGGSGKPAPGMGCALNSECAAGLICTFGFCHSQCDKDIDCSPGMCLKSTMVGDAGAALNVCQLATESHCYYNSDCQTPLVCGRDEKCRNQCQSNVDCVTGQVCTSSGVCADQSQIVAGTNDVTLVTTGRDGGLRRVCERHGRHGCPGHGRLRRRAPAPAGGHRDRRRGGRDRLGRVDGQVVRAAPPERAARLARAGRCTPGCGIGKQCVAGTCQPCGASAERLLRDRTHRHLQLQPHLRQRRRAPAATRRRPAATGPLATPGFQCVNGTCSCGGAGPELLRRRPPNAPAHLRRPPCGCAPPAIRARRSRTTARSTSAGPR